MITADAGGSNGYRSRLWKVELAELAATIGLAITVCHMPPGTSKWNKIEHRLFCFISMNWRGRPLTSHEVIVNHRRDHDPHRAHYYRRTGHRQLPHRHQDLRQADHPPRANPCPDPPPIPGEWNYTLSPPHDTPEPN